MSIDKALANPAAMETATIQQEITRLYESELAIHFEAEERFLFPAAEQLEEMASLVDELRIEHGLLRRGRENAPRLKGSGVIGPAGVHGEFERACPERGARAYLRRCSEDWRRRNWSEWESRLKHSFRRRRYFSDARPLNSAAMNAASLEVTVVPKMHFRSGTRRERAECASKLWMQEAHQAEVVENSEVSECLDRISSQKQQNRPISIYRLQLNAGFRFEDARLLLPYLNQLGITHCYFSPVLKARPGSLHGYDITDHNAFNPEIGTEDEFDACVREMRSLGMGLILDIVPNHMGIGFNTTPWWQDVLRNGEASEYANYFDIDWDTLKPELRGKVLLPILGQTYGEELEQGHIKLEYNEGRYRICYYNKKLPVDPQTYALIFEQVPGLQEFSSDAEWLNRGAAEFTELIGEFRSLPLHTTKDPIQVRQRRADIPCLLTRLAELRGPYPAATAIVDVAAQRMNGIPGVARSFGPMHRLLEGQAYRLAFWRVSSEEINYRRFFDINDLVGLRMENPAVFAATHRLIRKLLAQEAVTGLRLDHPDGLLNPIQYFTRLQMLYAASQCSGPTATGPLAETGIETEIVQRFGDHNWMGPRAPLYLVVEKILEAGEKLPQQWPVDGTVGYEFGNSLNNLFVQHQNERAFTNLYHRFIDGTVDVGALIYNSKKLIMDTALASEVTVLADVLQQIASAARRARDFTRNVLWARFAR